MSAYNPLNTFASSQHNPLSSIAQGSGFFDSSSLISQFFTGSMFFGGLGGPNNSTNFSSGVNGTMIWNSTTTDQYIHKGLESLVVFCFPNFVVQSPFFQFFISFMFYFITSNNIFTAGIALVIAGKVWNYMVATIEDICYTIKDLFNYSLEVKEKENYKFNTIYVCLMHWLGTVEHFQNAKHLTVHAKSDLTNNHRNNEENENEIILQLVPGPGTHGFYFKGHKITIQRVDTSYEKDKNSDKDDTPKLVLTVSAWNGKEILKNIIDEAIQSYFQSEKGVTSVYTLSSDYYRDWEKLCDRPYRSFDTVYLVDDVKDNLIKDLDRFMSNELFYRENSLNYQRGYLCYGPPGSGKSSLVLAMAAKLKCCLFSVNLNDKNLDDTKLQKMLTKLPKRGIILLEDIDAAFNENRKASEDVSGVSFSGLLNALDGVASYSQFPRIIFMTTNHIEKLDPALVRPGRIDFKIKFENGTKDQVRQMTTRFYKDEDLGRKMAELIPEGKLTTAEIQTYLMRYIYEKEECPNHVDEYLIEVENLRKELEKKKNESIEDEEDDDKDNTNDIKIEEELNNKKEK